ncbi:MAG TPA: hypothetical protein DCM37_13970 [Brucella melitensis]|nr:hypothetical protein [Brucella melitensis]HAK21201.1 hypothetical protein [Brucella melitensis]HCZ30122.1 hypothetical protein [Brucella melitensis]
MLICSYLILINKSVDGGGNIGTKLGRGVESRRTLGSYINSASQLYSGCLCCANRVTLWHSASYHWFPKSIAQSL